MLKIISHTKSYHKSLIIKICADLCLSLADQLCTSRDELERYEAAAKEMLPDVDYKAATTRKRIRKKVLNDGDSPELYLNARDKFRITTFCTIVDKLETEMKIRGEIYKEIAERFFFRVMCHIMSLHQLLTL